MEIHFTEKQYEALKKRLSEKIGENFDVSLFLSTEMKPHGTTPLFERFENLYPEVEKDTIIKIVGDVFDEYKNWCSEVDDEVIEGVFTGINDIISIDLICLTEHDENCGNVNVTTVTLDRSKARGYVDGEDDYIVLSKCPECHGVVELGSLICAKCGRRVEWIGEYFPKEKPEVDKGNKVEWKDVDTLGLHVRYITDSITADVYKMNKGDEWRFVLSGKGLRVTWTLPDKESAFKRAEEFLRRYGDV